MDQSEQIPAVCRQPLFLNQALTVTYHKPPSQQLVSDPVPTEDGVTNGTCEEEPTLCPFDAGVVCAGNTHPTVQHEDLSEFSNNGLSLPEVCVSTNSNSCEEDEMNHEVQQAYKIFTGFLLDKHKGITRPFLHPIGHQEAQRCIEGVQDRGPAQLKQSMCLRRMEEKFIGQEYETITEFVADFRLMLENCYRYHGVDHWISKQAQKLEIMLEQKLTLLSRTLREKTTLAVTSRGRFCAEEERGQGGTSTRRRLAPRSLATITVGGHESIMVQTLRLEEQQRAKEEKRQRELEKKEAVETSAKEVDKWEHTLLSQASPHTVDALWEIPAIGHFLCLAQTALNLPEIVFFELERCLLMPRCSLLLSKIMSSLLSTSQRRASVNRRPPLPYRHWESELRQRVLGWYRCVGASHDQPGRAEQLGLCQQFFGVLGEVSPLEEKPFHLLPFYQRVWLLKGLCDHVYETQKSVQDAVLAQPIHECRESILGYDSKENAYIHFPHFCGADLRIYRQSPSTPPTFPFPSLLVKKVAIEPGTKGVTSEAERKKSDGECYGGSVNTKEFEFHEFGRSQSETLGIFHKENSDDEEEESLNLSSVKEEEEGSESGSSEGESLEDSKMDCDKNSNILNPFNTNHTERCGAKIAIKEEEAKLQLQPVAVKKERKCSLSIIGTSKTETHEPCLSVGEHSYTGRSPARSLLPTTSTDAVELKIKEESPSVGRRKDSCVECFKNKINQGTSCSCETPGHATRLSYARTHRVGEKSTGDLMWTKKKKRKKKREHEQLSKIRGKHKRQQPTDQMSPSSADAAQSALRGVSPTISRKDKKRRHKTGKKPDATKKTTDEPPVEPSFKLVCRNLDELRDLISKTEDELDDLESTKKRLGRWYYKKEAVKELHSTLIRLLNELLPWEPRLVKAHQRNRLRLKKEFDDFKKHPEYNNFVREEHVTSSSSSSDEDEEKGLGKNLLSVADHYRKSEEEDLEHLVPRGLWSGAKTRESGTEAADETAYLSPTHLQVNTENGINPPSRPQTISRSTGFVANSGPQARTEGTSPNQSTDSNSLWAAAMPLQSPLSSKPTILHPTIGLPRGYTPIPVLLAKSVGNKVTLMKQPADCAGFNSVDAQSRGPSVPPPTSVMDKAKISKAQLWPYSSQKNSEQTKAQRQQQAHKQMEVAPVTKALGTSQQTKPNPAVPKNPVQVVCKSPQAPGHQEGKDGSSTAGPSVSPGENVMRQVVILTSLHQQPSRDVQVPVSQVVSPLCLSTEVSGFTIPENRIPVQPVAPLKDNMTVSNHSPSVSPCRQQGTLKTTTICSPQTSTPPSVTSNLGSPSSAAPTEPIKNTDPKQELKTVCIRDSQSILVTTRGGNTGIVKVQTSSDGAIGSVSTSPVITISPQFKAFLVSKTSPTFSSSPTPSCTIPAVNTSVSVAQPQRPVPPVLKSIPLPTSPLQSPFHSTTTGSIPITGAESQAKNSFVALSQSSTISASSTVPKASGHLAPVAAAVPASHHLASLVKSAVAVPSQSSTAVPQLLTQLEVTKTGLKRVGTDERAQVTKFILLTPSSSPTSSEAVSKMTSPTKKTLSNSKVMLIGQPAVTSSTASIGSIPTQALVTGASGQLLTTSLSSPTLKMGISPEQLISCGATDALTKVKNISLPSGFQIQLAGKTTAIGQTIGALSSSPSKKTPVSVSVPATVPGLMVVSNSKTNTTCSAPSASYTTLSTGSSMCTPSFTVVSQMASNTSTSVGTTLPTGTKKSHLDVRTTESTSNCPAQLPNTVPGSPTQRSTSLTHQQSSVQNNVVGDRFPLHNPLLNTPGTCAPSVTSAAGTIQQRIVINTSTPLAAGTQIILNNTRFVVPSQGLGPGSHVLIFSGPAPPQVPTASAAGTSASAAPQVANHAIVAPQVLPQSPQRPSGVPAATSPFVACTPAVGSPLLATINNIFPSHPTGMPGHSSASVSSKTIVSALPKVSAARTGDLAPCVVGTSGLSTVPALFSPVVTSAPASCISQTPVQLATASSAILSAGAHLLPRLSTPPSSATVPLSSPVKPVPALLASASTPLAAGTPLHSSVTQHMVSVTAPGQGIRPPQSGVQMAAPSTAPSQTVLQTGQGHAIRKHVPVVMQMPLSGTPSTVAVPPIVNLVSRIQTLPVATVPPIGTTARTFERVPVGITPSSSSNLVRTPAQPISSLKSNNGTHPAVISTNQTLGKHSSALGIQTSVAPKLLISPDGAVLSTVQCQVSPAEVTTVSKPTDVLVVSSSSSSGTLYTHDSSLQHSQAK